MSIATLGAIAESTFKIGRYTFNSLSGNNLTGVKTVSGDPQGSEVNVFQQACGNDVTILQIDDQWNISMVVEGADLATFARLGGITLGAAGQYGIPMKASSAIAGYLERRVYDKDFTTIRMAVCFPDVIMRNLPEVGDMDRSELTIPLTTFQVPYILGDNDGLIQPIVVHDTHAANGVLVDFTPTQTPVAIDTTNLNNQYAFYVKVDGARQVSGYTITPGTPVLTFDTAPADGTSVTMLYVYDGA